MCECIGITCLIFRLYSKIYPAYTAWSIEKYPIVHYACP